MSYVGRYTFDGCTGLQTAVLGHGYRKPTNYMFKGCTSLVSVVLPDGKLIPLASQDPPPITIDPHAFDGCTALTSIDIPYGYSGISNDAFNGCTSLKSISFWNSMTQAASDSSFSGCTSLTDIFYRGSVKEYSAMVLNLTGNDSYRLAKVHCEDEEPAILITTNLSSNSPFLNNTNITGRVVITDNVTSVPSWLF